MIRKGVRGWGRGCGNHYSVPARFIGHRLRVKLSASAVTVYDRTMVVARHQRAVGKGVKVLEWVAARKTLGDSAGARALRRHITPTHPDLPAPYRRPDPRTWRPL